MKVLELRTVIDRMIAEGHGDFDVRVGDVAEKDDLHGGVGSVVKKGECLVINPGDSTLWKDETVASETLSEELWKHKGEDE